MINTAKAYGLVRGAQFSQIACLACSKLIHTEKVVKYKVCSHAKVYEEQVTTNLFALVVSSQKTSRNYICFAVFLQKTKERLFEKSVECKDDVSNSIRHSKSRMSQLSRLSHLLETIN